MSPGVAAAYKNIIFVFCRLRSCSLAGKVISPSTRHRDSALLECGDWRACLLIDARKALVKRWSQTKGPPTETADQSVGHLAPPISIWCSGSVFASSLDDQRPRKKPLPLLPLTWWRRLLPWHKMNGFIKAKVVQKTDRGVRLKTKVHFSAKS